MTSQKWGNILYCVFGILANAGRPLTAGEVKELIRGRYGKTAGPINPEVQKLAIGDEKVIDHRPADDIKPQLKTMRDRLDEAGYPGLSVEDVLSYALFPDVALNYFRSHR